MILRNYFAAFALILCFFGWAQDLTIEDNYDRLTENWLEVSKELKSYAGLSEFCINEELRNYTTNILLEMHQYDSVVMSFLLDPKSEQLIGSHEYRSTLEEIGKFENEYGIQEFIHFLKNSCITRNELEKDKSDLKKQVGMYSYDGQIVVLETDIHRFLKNIDKRVVSIDKHLHKIHPDRFQMKDSFMSNMDE